MGMGRGGDDVIPVNYTFIILSTKRPEIRLRNVLDLRNTDSRDVTPQRPSHPLSPVRMTRRDGHI